MITSPASLTRRAILAAAPFLGAASPAPARPRLDLILAPTNLGLRPLTPGMQPGTWAAPQALQSAGLAERLNADRIAELDRRTFRFEAESGTRIRNGHAIRDFSQTLGDKIGGVLRDGAFPLVIGGDCSILLGCLLGARTVGPLGLLHVDGHSDFFHPGNYDSETRLGSVAGMDLALATGRGEPLLARWGGEPLVEDRYVVQIGERETLRDGLGYGDIVGTEVRRLPVRRILRHGLARTVDEALAPVAGERRRMWLHIDLDVLDQRDMPAVDSPGSPGLDFLQLAALIEGLLGSGRVLGADVAIFDPDLDPTGGHARAIVACLARGFAGLRRAALASRGVTTRPRSCGEAAP